MAHPDVKLVVMDSVAFHFRHAFQVRTLAADAIRNHGFYRLGNLERAVGAKIILQLSFASSSAPWF